LDLFETHQARVFPPLTVYVRNSGVVGHPERPRLQRATSVKNLEASPELKVDVLTEIVPLFGVGFVSGGQSIERAPKFADGGLVRFVPLRRRRRPAAMSATHNINSRCIGNFITSCNYRMTVFGMRSDATAFLLDGSGGGRPLQRTTAADSARSSSHGCSGAVPA